MQQDLTKIINLNIRLIKAEENFKEEISVLVRNKVKGKIPKVEKDSRLLIALKYWESS